MKFIKLKKGYIILVVISLSMIMMVFMLNYFNKEKLIVKELQGNSKDMGELELVYNPNTSFFNHEEIKLNENGLSSKINMKFSLERDCMEVDKGYSTLFNWDEDRLSYSNEEYAGTADFTYYDEDINSNRRSLRVNNKNLQTNITETMDILIEDDRFNSGYIGVHFNLIYDDNLYMVVNQGANDENGSNQILIIKIDLINKDGEIVGAYTIYDDVENHISLTNISFINNGKIYVLLYDPLKGSNKFLIYDIDNRKFIESNYFLGNSKEEGYAKDKEILEIAVYENRIKFLLRSNNHTGGKISQFTYKVDNDNVELESAIECDFKIPNKSNIKKLRFVDDKIYILTQSKNDTIKKLKNDKSFTIMGVKPVNFTVYDIKLDKIVYEAELMNSDVNLSSKLYFKKKQF